jgi:hypothetical protein
MSMKLLAIAVVGHTNTGKTSLIRTLTQNRDFGDVADRGGTTRQVTSSLLGTPDQALIELYDSPGLENAPQLIEWLEQLPGQRHAGVERIGQFLADPEARQRFDQEARVLELILAVDVGLYVIDAREPVLEKYQDELAVLGECAKPLIAVLNFTASPASRESQWREALARVKVHTVLAFDAVVRDPTTEQRLFEKLKSLLDDWTDTLETWLELRASEQAERRAGALQTIADLLIDAAACQRRIRIDDEHERAATLTDIRQLIRQREQACVDTLLDLYRFGSDDYSRNEGDDDLPLVDGRWPEDLFDPQTLSHYGLSTSRHIGAGAGAGAVFDIATGGLSLGAGTLIGGLAGAGVGLVRTLGAGLVDRARGTVRLGIDDGVLRLLAWRQLHLLNELIRRGHASQQALTPAARDRWQIKRLPAALRKARHHPGWSSLNSGADVDSGRDWAAATLAEDLGDALDQAGETESNKGNPDSG